MVYCDGKRIENCYSYFIKAINNTFYGFTCVITHLGCWENTQTACKITRLLLVIYKLFSCSFNVRGGLSRR